MKPFYDDETVTLFNGDCREVLRALPESSVNCCVTSPPYWGLRDYGVDGQMGLEKSPAEYATEMTGVFREVRRVLRDDGTLWLNIGDTYNSNPSWGRGTSTLQGRPQDQIPGKPSAGWLNHAKTDTLKSKDLVGIPWVLAFALRDDGWYLRSDIIWHKPNPMPESVTDRPTKSHEYLFLMSKSDRYFYNADALREPHSEISLTRAAPHRSPPGRSRREGLVAGQAPHSCRLEQMLHPNGRNKRTVWTVSTVPTPFAHFATFPPKLIEPCILAGCPDGGTVLDPFFGAGTTGVVCKQQHVRCIGIELNPSYCEIAAKRLAQGVLFGKESA